MSWSPRDVIPDHLNEVIVLRKVFQAGQVSGGVAATAAACESMVTDTAEEIVAHVPGHLDAPGLAAVDILVDRPIKRRRKDPVMQPEADFVPTEWLPRNL